MAAWACGGPDAPEAPDTGGNGKTPQAGEAVTGSERLGWTQVGTDADSFTYALYIDGARTDLRSVICRVTIGDQYDCSAPLPSMPAGRHVLELTATRGTQESPRSQPLAVVMSTASVATSGTLPSAQEHDPYRSRVVCSNSGLGCYTADILARGIDRGRSLAPAPDDRAFLVSGEGRVVAVGPDGRILPIAVEPPCRPARASHLAALAVSPGFIEDRAIYAAWVCAASGQRGRLLAVSYRELGGSLGEARVHPLVDTDTRLARVSLNDIDRLYVSTPHRNGVNVYRVALFRSALIDPRPELVARGSAGAMITASQAGVFVMDEGGVASHDLARPANSRKNLLQGARISVPGNWVSLTSERSPGADELIWLADPLGASRLRVTRTAGSVSELREEVRLDLSGFGSVTDFAAGYRGDLYALVRENGTVSHAVLRLHPR